MECSVYSTVQFCPVTPTYIKKVVDSVLTDLHVDGNVSVHCIGEKKMQILNREYRGKDRPTDVLSFASQEGDAMPGIETSEIGDIFLCVPYIQKQAREFGVRMKEEFTRMLVHGVLHTLGYDHIKKSDAAIMFSLQEKFVREHI